MRHRINSIPAKNNGKREPLQKQKRISARRYATRLPLSWCQVFIKSLVSLLFVFVLYYSSHISVTRHSSLRTSNSTNRLRWAYKSNQMKVSSDSFDLRNLHLVMVGDSVTRYQYLSLAWYARYGEWYESGKSLGGSLDIFRHKTFNIPFLPNGTWWNAYYWFTNQFLQPYEHCDCYKVGPELSQMCENRYYWDPARNLSLSYMQAYGHSGGINGHVTAEDAFLNATQTANMNDTFAWSWERWDKLITLHVAKLRPKPKIAILNAGIWENFFSDDTRTPINLAEALNRANITGIWKTTTFRNDTLPGRHRWTINRDSDPIMVSH